MAQFCLCVGADDGDGLGEGQPLLLLLVRHLGLDHRQEHHEVQPHRKRLLRPNDESEGERARTSLQNCSILKKYVRTTEKFK